MTMAEFLTRFVPTPRPTHVSFGGYAPGLNQRFLDTHWFEFRCPRETVPAYGVIEVREFEFNPNGAGVRLLAQKPTEKYEDRYPKFINGPVPVERDESGRCTRSGLIVANMEEPSSGEGELAYGDWFVPEEDGEYVLKRTRVPPPGSAFTYMGGFQEGRSASTGVGVFQYLPVPHVIVYGKLTEDLDAADDDDGWEDEPKEADAKILEYDFDSHELTVGTEIFTVKNRTNVSFDNGTRFGAQRARGEWVITFTGC